MVNVSGNIYTLKSQDGTLINMSGNQPVVVLETDAVDRKHIGKLLKDVTYEENIVYVS